MAPQGREARSSAVTDMSDKECAGPVAHFACLVSRIGHPLVFITVSAGIVFAKQLPARRALLILVALLFSVILPTAFLLVTGARSGRRPDANVSERDERRRFYPWAILFSVLGAFLMWWIQAPMFVLHGACVMLAVFILAAIINTWIKISLHALFASYCAVILFQVDVAFGVAAAIMAAFVFWSRLFLSRHTLIEAVAGIGLGVGGGIVAVWWPG